MIYILSWEWKTSALSIGYRLEKTFKAIFSLEDRSRHLFRSGLVFRSKTIYSNRCCYLSLSSSSALSRECNRFKLPRNQRRLWLLLLYQSNLQYNNLRLGLKQLLELLFHFEMFRISLNTSFKKEKRYSCCDLLKHLSQVFHTQANICTANRSKECKIRIKSVSHLSVHSSLMWW